MDFSFFFFKRKKQESLGFASEAQTRVVSVLAF